MTIEERLDKKKKETLGLSIDERIRRRKNAAPDLSLTDTNRDNPIVFEDSKEIMRYMPVTENPDFAEKSQYAGSKDSDYMSTSKLFDTKGFKKLSDVVEKIGNAFSGNSIENLYNEINVKKQSNNPFDKVGDMLKSHLGYENSPADVMTDNEKALFNYYYNTGDYDTAQDLYNSISSELTDRVRALQADKANKNINNALDVAAVWPGTVLPKISAGLGQVGLGAMSGLYEAVTGGDPLKAWNDVAKYNFMGSNATAQLAAAGNKIGEATGSETLVPMAYQALTSVLDSMVAMGIGSTLGLSEMALKALTKLPMSGNVAMQKSLEVLSNGGTQEEAALSSLASGAVSYIAESLGTDTMFDILTGKLGAKTAREFIIKALISSAGAEGLEEGAEDLGNLITDYLILDTNKDGAKSEWAQHYDELVQSGLGENEAKAQTIKDFVKNVGLDMFGGALGGLFGGGIEAGPGYFNYRQSGQAIKNSGNIERLSEQLKAAGRKDLAETVANAPSDSNIGFAQDTLIKETLERATDKRRPAEERIEAADTLKNISENVVAATGISDKKGNALHLTNVAWDGNTPTFITEEGTYSLNDVNISDSTSRLVTLTENLPEAARKAFVQNYYGGSLGDYVDAFNLAYYAGQKGYRDRIQRLIDDHVLTELQANNIFDAATLDPNSVRGQLNALNERIEQRKKLFPDKKLRAVIDDSHIDYSKLSDDTKDDVKFCTMVADAFNVNLVVYDSQTTDREDLKNSNGAHYDPTNTIFLDVNAVNTGTEDNTEHAIVTAMSHELTHWAKYNAPIEFAHFREAVLSSMTNEYNKENGTDLDIAGFVRLMKNKTPSYRSLSIEKTEEELICRGCENMLQNSRFAEQALGQLTAREQQTLTQKVHELFEKVRALIKKIMGRSDSKSYAYRLLARSKENLDDLQKRWDNMIEKAAENSAYKNAEIAEGKVETAETEAEEIAFSKKYNVELINWHSKSVGPFEVKVSKGAINFISKYAKRVSPKEYKILNSAVLENNGGKLHPNSMGCETTFDHLYVYFVDSKGVLNVLIGEDYNEVDRSRDNLGKQISEAVARLWDGEEGSRNSDAFHEHNRKYRDIAEAARKLVENRQAASLSFSVRGETGYDYSKRVSAEPNYDATEDSAGRQLSAGQQVYFARSAIRDNDGRLLVVYHGTPTGGFTVFRNGLTYFTANKDYAERYTRASSNGRTGSTPQVYSGYINIVKPFALTDSAAKDIYINEYIKGGYAQGMDPNASDAEINKYAENGIDWTEADNLKEFFDEKGYDYDGIILNEGGDLTDKGTVMRGNSFVTFSQEQFKDRENKTPTINPDINLSWKDNEGYLHLDFDDELSPEELANYVSRVFGRQALDDILKKKTEEKVKRYTAKLKKLNREMKISPTKLDAIAHTLKEDYNLPQTITELKNDLKEVYVKMNDTQAFDSAISELENKLFKDSEANYIDPTLKREAEALKKELRTYTFSLSENQKKELKYAYGSNWSQRFLGKVKFRKDGVPLDELWSTFVEGHPELFTDAADADQAIQLAEAVDRIYSGDYYTSKVLDDSGLRKASFATAVKMSTWDIIEDLTMAEKYQEVIGELREKVRQTDEAKKKLQREIAQAREDVKEDARRQRLIDKIMEREKKLATMLRKNDAKNHVPQILQEPLKDIFNAVDVSAYVTKDTSKDFLALAKALENVSTNSEAEENLQMYFDSSSYFVDAVRDIAEEVQKKVADLKEETGERISILDLSSETLKKLNMTLAAITTAARNYDRALASETNQRISERDNSTMSFVGRLTQRGKVAPWAKDLLTFISWDNVTPVYGYDRFGQGGKDTFAGIMDGDDQLTRNEEKIIEYCVDSFTGEEAETWTKELHPIKLNGKEYQLTTAQIMTLYCLDKRPAAHQHLYEDQTNVYDEKISGRGIVIAPNEKLEKTVAIHVTPNEVKQITSLLNDRQTEVADKLQKFMANTCADWGNYVTMRRFGIMQFGEENYFPMDVSQVGAEEKPTSNNSWRTDIFRLLNMGFTKSLNERGNGALIIDSIFDVFFKHTGEMAAYNAYALPILDAYKWMSYKSKGWEGLPAVKGADASRPISFAEVVEQVYGADGMRFIQNHLKDLNGTKNISTSADSIAKRLIRNYKAAATAANARVVLMQPMSYFRAFNEIDSKYLAKAINVSPKAMRATIADMNEKSALAAKKNGLGAYDVNISRSIAEQAMQTEKAGGVKGTLQKIRTAAMWAAMKADEITWGTLWRATQLETADKHPELKNEDFDNYVAKRFRDICYRTQVFDSINARSNLMRKDNPWLQILTAFGSEPTLSWSMLSNNVFMYTVEARNGNASAAWHKYGQKIKRSLVAFMMSALAVSAVAALPDWMRDDDDDDGFLKRYFKQFGLNVLGEVTGLLPFIRDIADVAIRGYDPSRPDEEIFRTGRQTFNALKKAADEGQITYRTVYQAAKLFSQATGMPFANVLRDLKAFWNKTVGEVLGIKIQ